MSLAFGDHKFDIAARVAHNTVNVAISMRASVFAADNEYHMTSLYNTPYDELDGDSKRVTVRMARRIWEGAVIADPANMLGFVVFHAAVLAVKDAHDSGIRCAPTTT